MPRDLSVRCPCCGATLDVDARTGNVLRHHKPGAQRPDPFSAPRPAPDADEAFRKAQEQMEQRKRQMEDRFGREASRPHRDRNERPPHPFDND